MLLYSTLCLPGTLAYPDTMVQRINYGTIFKHVGRMDICEQYWSHSFEVKLPVNIISAPVPTPPGDTVWDRLTRNTLMHVTRRRNNASQTLQDTIEQIKQLIPNYDTPNKVRSSRSLIPFVGTIFKGLFGVASENDLSVLKNHMAEMSSKTNKMMNAFKSNTHLFNSWMQTMNKRMDNTVEALAQTNNITSMLAQSLNDTLKAFDFWPLTIRVISDETYNAMYIQMCAEQLLNGVQRLMTNKMPVELIPLNILKQAIGEVSAQVRKQYPMFSVSKINPEYYYTHMPVSYGRIHDSIFINIKIPITSYPVFYNIYQILTVSVPINESSHHSTEIQHLPSHIAVADNKRSYIEMQQFQISQCFGSFLKHCPILLARTQADTHTCASALFFKKNAKVKLLCDFMYTRHSNEQNMFEISPGKLFITNVHSIIISCKDKISKQPGCRFCLITIPCQCTLKLDFRTIPNRVINCDRDNQFKKIVPCQSCDTTSFLSYK